MKEAINPKLTLNFEQQLDELQAVVNDALNRILPSENQEPKQLHQAMRYAVMAGGKRIRPILTYATGMALDIPLTKLNGIACAIELIHTYSLIHDDLPAMDDDDLRRGQPTCHKAFNEAIAILAGDALQALAFEVLVNEPHHSGTDKSIVEMIQALTQAAGHAGMAGGQAIDLAAVNQNISLQNLQYMHSMKTGALIKASVILPAISSANTNDTTHKHLCQYAEQIGLAFQIQDDILDVISDTETLGKTQGSDMALNKPTYYSLLGLEGARQKLHDAHQSALQALSTFDHKADLLREIANYIVARTY